MLKVTEAGMKEWKRWQKVVEVLKENGIDIDCSEKLNDAICDWTDAIKIHAIEGMTKS